MEEDENHTITYLDVKKFHKFYKINTTVYRKSAANLSIISHRDNTPLTYRLAALHTYINIALYFCSTEEFLREELKIMENIGLNAGHPKKIINKLIGKDTERIDRIQLAQENIRLTPLIPYRNRKIKD